MDEVTTMTVPPTLPAKTQPPSQVARQTVSIRTVSNPPTAPLSTGAGATVFVGLAAPGVDSSAACRRRIPEVQAANGYGKQSGVKSAQSSPQNQQQQQQQQHNNYNNHYQQQQQQQQQAAHVVKIKINPDGEKNGRVISTVRLTLDEKVAGHEAEKENGIACERSGKRDGGVVVSATNLVNEQRCGSGGVGDGCVRISVGSNAFERNNNHDNSNLRKDKRDRNHDNTEQKDMVLHRETSIEPPMNASSPNNNRSTACFYYNSYPGQLNGMVMSSGQCSPSDTLDSGTCSDLDGTPPPLPKKKNSSTVILASDQHNRTGSLTSSGAEVDSDDNESNISCDSLNGGELTDRIANGGINGNEAGRPSLEFPERSENCRVKNGVDREKCRDTGTVLALNRLDLSSTDRNEENRIHEEESSAAASSPEIGSSSCSTRASPSVSPSPSGTSSLSKASSTPRIRSPVLATEQNGRLTSPVVKECTYEERKQEQERLEQESGDVDTSVNPLTGKKYVYEYDRFYKFHINELKGNKDSGRGVVLGDKETDECFAGYKILEKEAIRSAKGTVRGVKNRVRAGIATFLQKPSSQAYIKKELGKVVVYTTTSGIVRKTFYNCKKVKQILRTHMVKYDELDLFGDAELQTELRDRLGSTVIQLPQLFIDGQHIGGFDTVERLNESGELREMLKPYQSEDACTVCLFCGGYQWQLCPVCNGSKRSVHRNDFTAEFVALKCAKCDVNGLIRCPHC